MRPGCRRSFNAVDIPPFMSEGAYEYVVTIDYSNNPLFSGKLTLPVPEVRIE